MRRRGVELTIPQGGHGPLISTNVSMGDFPKVSHTQGKSSRASENQQTAPDSTERIRHAYHNGEGEENAHRVCARVAQDARASREHEHQSVEEHKYEEGDDYNSDNEFLDDEERVIAIHMEQRKGPLINFPTHEEYMEGYIWKMDFLFDVPIANV